MNIQEAYSENQNSEMANILHRPIRALGFPPTSTMGVSATNMLYMYMRKKIENDTLKYQKFYSIN